MSLERTIKLRFKSCVICRKPFHDHTRGINKKVCGPEGSLCWRMLQALNQRNAMARKRERKAKYE